MSRRFEVPASFEPVQTLEGIHEYRHRTNGLTVLIVPTPVAPVASFGVVYQVGSRNERSGYTGASHILEHLMFKGSARFNRELGTEIARTLQRTGAIFNATTWYDRTFYYETLPADHLPLAMQIEADRMRGALLKEEDLAAERTVVLNELSCGENDPLERLMKESFAHAFLEHPYHNPTIGWRSDVEQISLEMLRDYYDTYYHPDNATAIIAGEVDEVAGLEEVERCFGKIPAAPKPIPRVSVREAAQRGQRRFELHAAGELARLLLTWRTPEALHPDAPVLSVLAQVLTDGVLSRLYQALVDTKDCLSVRAFPAELHDPGVLQLFLTLAPGTTLPEIEEKTLAQVRALQDEPPSAEEVDRAKVKVRTDLAFQQEAPAHIVAGLTEAIAVGDWRRFAREMEVVSAITAADLSRVATDYLQDTNLTVGWFVPEGNSE